MSTTKQRILSTSVGLVALWMFYLIGGWKLPVAMLLFGWGMNLENSAKVKDALR